MPAIREGTVHGDNVRNSIFQQHDVDLQLAMNTGVWCSTACWVLLLANILLLLLSAAVAASKAVAAKPAAAAASLHITWSLLVLQLICN